MAGVVSIGPLVEDGKVAQAPLLEYRGQHVILQRLQSHHVEPLWNNIKNDKALWDYMPGGPFSTLEEFRTYVVDILGRGEDPFLYAIMNQKEPSDVVGFIALMAFSKPNRSNEVGHVLLSHKLQKSTMATETIYLLLKASFEQLNSRRVEWKTNVLNQGSRKAALRFGFSYEGIFRNHYIIKGHSRDTIWFSIIESEWPARKATFEAWLDPTNFDKEGKQIKSFTEFSSSSVKSSMS